MGAKGKAKKAQFCVGLQQEGLLWGFGIQRAAGGPGGVSATLGSLLCCLLCPAHSTRENPSQAGNVSMECEEHCPHLRL